MKELVFCTCPDRNTAEKLAHALVEQRLAACVNIVNSIQSIYQWQGEIRKDEEVLLLIKTDKTHFGALNDTITGLHPYEVPEIIAIPVEDGHQPYLKWIDSCLAES